MSTQEAASGWFLSINEQDHRKGAKIAKCFIALLENFSAMKTVFMGGHYLRFIPFFEVQ